jgi:hypothetical protein
VEKSHGPGRASIAPPCPADAWWGECGSRGTMRSRRMFATGFARVHHRHLLRRPQSQCQAALPVSTSQRDEKGISLLCRKPSVGGRVPGSGVKRRPGFLHSGPPLHYGPGTHLAGFLQSRISPIIRILALPTVASQVPVRTSSRSHRGQTLPVCDSECRVGLIPFLVLSRNGIRPTPKPQSGQKLVLKFPLPCRQMSPQAAAVSPDAPSLLMRPPIPPCRQTHPICVHPRSSAVPSSSVSSVPLSR